jgi:hypothetical protein
VKEDKMTQPTTPLVLKKALSGFVPGAFLFMAIIALPRLFQPHPVPAILVFALEQVLLAGGFALMILALGPKHFAQGRWRNVLAGVGGVFLLALLSGFLQALGFFRPAGLATIAIVSISAGMLSILFAFSRIQPAVASGSVNHS